VLRFYLFFVLLHYLIIFLGHLLRVPVASSLKLSSPLTDYPLDLPSSSIIEIDSRSKGVYRALVGVSSPVVQSTVSHLHTHVT
jgi:hypothetical protein